MTDYGRRPDPDEPTGQFTDRFTPGAILGGRYRVERQLGRGGMGEVWQAFDLKLRVDVALKALRDEFFANAAHRDLLRREVRVARDVHSSNVCRIFDLVEIDGQEMVSMEYVDGSTLLQVLAERGPLDLAEAREIALQFLAGLEAIHRAGLIHRDLKPENIMITRSGRVLVMDFGIAKGVRRAEEPGGTIRISGRGANTIAGTPAYMSPEQFRGDELDGRSDIFSAGIVLAEMVSRDKVSDRDTRESLWSNIRAVPAVLPETPWEPVLRRCVSPDPAARPGSAVALARALEEITLRVENAEDRSPYPGLSAFSEENAEFFFGREAEVEETWRKLQTLQMLAVIGPSGVGKSSFLRAGVIPARPSGWDCIVCTPGSSPFGALAESLAPALAGDADAVRDLVRFDDPEAAVSAARRWRQGHDEALLILDQFEELFTQNPVEVQARFADLLGRLAFEADVRVLVSMRDDFFFRCHEFQSLAPLFSEPRPLGPPTGESLRRALVQPALICGYRLEEALAEEMLSELGQARGALPLLAFAAERLWEHRDRSTGELTRDAHAKIGGVGGALAQHAERALEEAGSGRQEMVREIFRNLVTAEGTRRSADWDQLLSVFTDREAASKVLRGLIDARLLTSYETRDEGDEGRHRVEIVHEILLSSWPRLVRWQTQDADGAQLRDQLRQAAQLWDERDRSRDLLWTGTALKEFRVWRERYAGGLSQLEADFASSMEARESARRRRRNVGLAGSFALLVAVLVVVGLSRQNALEQALRAEANELLARGREYADQDPTWSLACALASLERHDSRQARLFALETLLAAPPRFVFPQSGFGWAVEFSPDGRWLAEGDGDGGVRLWSVDGGPAVEFDGMKGISEVSLTFHPHRAWLLQVGQDSTRSVCVWSVPDGEVLFRPELGGQTDASWGDDGNVLITATEDGEGSLTWRSWSVADWTPTELGTAGTPRETQSWRLDREGRRIVDYDGKRLRVFEIDRQRPGLSTTFETEMEVDVRGAVLSPDGTRLFAGDGRGEVRVWELDLVSGGPGRVIGHHPSVETLHVDSAGRYVGTCGDDGNFCYWDLEAPPDAGPVTLRRDVPGGVSGAAFHPAGSWIAVSSTGGWLSLWPRTREYPLVFRGHTEGVKGVVVDPTGSWMASVSGDMTVRIWKLSPEADVPVWSREYRDFYDLFDLALDGTGEHLFLGGPSGLSLLDRADGSPTQLRPLSRTSVIYAVALSPDGRLAAATGGWDVEGPITVWNLETDETWLLDAGDSTVVADLEFSPDGTLFAAGVAGLRRWDPHSASFDTLCEETVWQIDLSGDGTRLVHAGPEKVLLHDLQTNEARELVAHRGQEQCAIDATGKWIVTGGRNGEIRFGSVTSDEVHLLLGHESGVSSVDFDPLGRWIVSSGGDGTIRLWPIPEGRPFHTLPRDEIVARLSSLLNIRIVRNADAPDGWSADWVPFDRWTEAPTW